MRTRGLRRISNPSRLFLLLSVSSGSFAAASAAGQASQSSDQLAAIRAACAEDAKKLCAGVQPGGGRIVACLKEHKDSLSDRCKQAAGLAAANPSSGSAPAAAGRGPSGGANGPGATSSAPTAASASPSGNGSKTASAAKSYKMKQVQIIDKGGFEKPIAVADLLIPSDWQFQGTVKWANRGCFSDLAAVSFRAQSPDGKIVVEGFPSFSWQFSQDPSVQKYLGKENQDGLKVGLKPCPVNPPTPAADVLRKVVVPQNRPGKEIVSIDPMADLNQTMNSRTGGVEQQVAQSGQQVQVRADAARARLKYDESGQAVEEWITAVSFVQATKIAVGASVMQGIDCRATMLFAMRAPAGQLEANETLFRMIRSSLQQEPEWHRRFFQNWSQLSKFQASQRKKRADMIGEFQRHEIEVINGVVANRERGADQAALGADRLTRGVEPYRDPETGQQYELSYMYGNAWINSNDKSQIVLSDDPNFQPGTVFNGNWSPLEHVQPTP